MLAAGRAVREFRDDTLNLSFTETLGPRAISGLPKPFPNLVKELALFLKVWFWVTITVGGASCKCRILDWGLGCFWLEFPWVGPQLGISTSSPGDFQQELGDRDSAKVSMLPVWFSLPPTRCLGFWSRSYGVSVTDVLCCLTHYKWLWMADFANSGTAFQKLACISSFDVRLFAIISYCLQCGHYYSLVPPSLFPSNFLLLICCGLGDYINRFVC